MPAARSRRSSERSTSSAAPRPGAWWKRPSPPRPPRYECCRIGGGGGGNGDPGCCCRRGFKHSIRRWCRVYRLVLLFQHAVTIFERVYVTVVPPNRRTKPTWSSHPRRRPSLEDDWAVGGTTGRLPWVRTGTVLPAATPPGRPPLPCRGWRAARTGWTTFGCSKALRTPAAR